MKKTLQKLFIVSVLLYGANNAFSQITTSAINSAPSDNNRKIEEVYGPNFFDNKQDLLRHFHHLLSYRIEYKNLPPTTDEKYPKLSAVPLMNKHGEISIDRGFNPNTFNPLRYELNFFSKQTQIYRIDDSDYVLIIKPQ